jgi:putative DNA-binding phage protein
LERGKFKLDINIIIGEKIKEIRKNKKLTQARFGELLGVNKKTVILWEKGKSLPNKERLKNIAILGGTSVRELLKTNSLEQYSINELFEELQKRILKIEELKNRILKK